MKLTTLPQLTQNELHILLAGLDELPGKFSRMLHRKITDHVEGWIAEMRAADEKAEEEIRKLKEDAAKRMVEAQEQQESAAQQLGAAGGILHVALNSVAAEFPVGTLPGDPGYREQLRREDPRSFDQKTPLIKRYCNEPLTVNPSEGYDPESHSPRGI